MDSDTRVVRKLRMSALVVGLVVFLFDTWTKSVIQKTAWLHYYPLLKGLLTIQYARNEGIAFGLFHDLDSSWKGPVLAGMAVLALAMVLYYLWTTPPSERLVFLSLGLLLGGILGNFVDRLRHSYVVDFIKVHWGPDLAWPTFNVADAAITVGVLTILFATVISGLRQTSPSQGDAKHSQG